MSITPVQERPAAAEHRAQRFVGSSVRDVYAQVRAALGPDALILEQRSRDGRVEVLAGHDAADAGSLLPREHVLRGLKALGLGAAALAQLPATMRHPRDVEDALDAAIACAPPSQPLCGHFRFIGPPGAGKTTALIKLAASRVLRYGRRGTLLVATDHSRLAGCEQLASSAELLGVEYLECSERKLPEVLHEWRHMPLVLVDAAGVRGGHIAAPLRGVEDVLVVPAVWQGAGLGRLRQQLQFHPLSGLLLSHVDQAHTLLECAGLLVEWQLPVWWIGHGGDLAAELDAAEPGRFVRSFLTEFDRSSLEAIFQHVV